jgi:hypothetical protein
MKTILDAADADRWLSVAGVFHEGRNLTLRFEAPFSDATKPVSAWLVSCHRVRDFRLTDFDGGGLNLWRGDHPVAWQFSSPKASLRIDFRTRTYAECAGVLLVAHQTTVDDWIDFDRFVRLDKTSKASSRQLTVLGPRFLLSEYHKHLARAGFSVRFKNYKRKLYWSGLGWSERRHNVSVLHFGASFVAAESFSAIEEAVGHVRSTKRVQPTAQRKKPGGRG